MKKFFVCLFLLLFFLTSCKPSHPSLSTPTAKLLKLEGEKVSWNTVSTYNFIKVNNKASKSEDKPREAVLIQPEDITIYNDWITSTDLEKIKAIDFSKSITVIVFMGERGSDQYNIEINDIRKNGHTVSIYADFIMPIEGQERHPIVTSPYYILEIEKRAEFIGTFNFILNNKGEIIDQVKIDIPH